MDCKKLKALAAAVETGSLTRAAEMLNYTQSGLSHMMDKLEDEVGFPLTERGYYGIRLSPEGEKLMPYIKALLAADDDFCVEAGAIIRSRNDTIKVGSYSSMIMSWMPGILEKYSADYPNVNVELVVPYSVEELYDWLDKGQADVVFSSRQDFARCSWERLMDDPLMAVLPADCDVGQSKSYDIRDFDGAPFCMPPQGGDNDVIRVLERYNVHPQILPAQVDDAAAIAFVSHGMGVSIMAQLVLKNHKSNIKELPLSPECHRELGMAVRSAQDTRRTVKDFMKCARQYVAAIDDGQRP